MSHSLLDEMPPADAVDTTLAIYGDLFDRYYDSGSMPSAGWLKKLRLKTPRRNVQCLTQQARIVKRCIDIAGCLVLMTVTAPLVVISAILVKLTSPGPLIYRQTRVGLNLREKASDRRSSSDPDLPEDRREAAADRRGTPNYGKLFTLYKIRTMRTDAEQGGAQFATSNDPRMTWVGRILRRTRIDELPQLWNVLQGDMSLVGPRPERPEFMEELSREIPNYLDRLGLKPGITGLAQVENGYDNEIESFRRKVAYDLLYLQNCCGTNDLRILIRTVWIVLSGRGAI